MIIIFILTNEKDIINLITVFKLIMRISKNNRILTFICAVFLFSVVNGILFQRSHFEHDCKGEDCPTCALIQAISNSVLSSDFSKIKKNTDFKFCILIFITFIHIEFLIFDTPVKKKIRLLF